MYARVGTAQVAQSGNSGDLARRVKEIVIPVLKQQKGFNKLYILLDRETGKAYSINFWDSEADLKAFVESETQAKLQAKMREAGGAQMTWGTFEVIVEA
jgi:heme-degrading monooxygenase HmoA